MVPLDVVVAICTYRRPSQLALLLEALQKQVLPGDTSRIGVLVVDNSPDHEAAPVAQASSGPLAVNYLAHGAGNIASGRNATLGWTCGRARFVAMIDDDELPEPDWLERLLAAQSASGADVVTGPVLARYPDGAPAWLQRDHFFSVVGPTTGSFVDEAVSGNALISCDVVRRLSLTFDESLGTSGGEDQLFFRAARAGGARLWYAPDCRVHELVPAARLSARYLLRREYRKGNTLGLLDRSRPGWPVGRPRRRLAASAYWLLTGARRALAGVLRRDRAAVLSGAVRAARGAGMLSGLRGVTYALYAQPVTRRPTIALVAEEDPRYQAAGHSQFLSSFVSHYVGLGAQVVVVLTSPRLSFIARRSDVVVYRSPALRTWRGVQVVVSPKVVVTQLAWRAFRIAPRPAQRGVDRIRTALRARQDVDHRLGAWLTPDQDESVRSMLAQEQPDAVLFSGLFCVPTPLQLPSGVRSAVLINHDVVSERAEHFRARGYRVAPAGFSEADERTALKPFSTIVAIQWDDAAVFQRFAPHATVIVVPVSVDLPPTARDGVHGERCLFVGSGSLANVDGLQWFLEHCWADVRARVPQAELHVVGTVCARVGAEPEGVVLRGEVRDLAEEYASAAVAIVPMRTGSGLKVKIVEALCSGVPVVTTSIGAQGLGSLAPRPYLEADEPHDFTRGLVHVLHDDALREQLAEAARSAAPLFSPQQAFEGLDQALRDAGLTLVAAQAR